jgi:NAD(P)-dependent dehydrogenase (short-subunit alcohol dehydrogenase family)
MPDRRFSRLEMQLNNANITGDDPDAGAARALDGKAILITGGASGLGAALCDAMSAAGAHVMVADIDEDKAHRAIVAMHATGARAIRCDVGDPADAERTVDATVAAFGKIDILINNAGTDMTRAIDELSFADWDRVIHTNLYGPFLLAKFAVPYMKRAGRGQIVNIASTAARRAWPNASAYHASKWGLLGMSNALHAELRPCNIKVTAVIAGGMRTPFLLDRFPDIDQTTLQEPARVAQTVKMVLQLPDETAIPEIMVLPMRETSWP